MTLEILKIVLIICGIVYIESQTFIIERLISILFHEKEIPVEVMPEFTSSSSIDTEEIQTRERLQQEVEFMNEYIYSNINKENTTVSIDLDDDDYVPLTPSEVSM